MEQISEQYKAEYFNWQREVGKFGGKANLFKFRDHIKATDRVLDFGCGGGFLLEQLNCAQKVGIDINPVIESPDGVTILKSYEVTVEAFGANSFDVVISFFAGLPITINSYLYISLIIFVYIFLYFLIETLISFVERFVISRNSNNIIFLLNLLLFVVSWNILV